MINQDAQITPAIWRAKIAQETSLQLGSGSFRSRRGGIVDRSSLGRSTASGLGRGAAAALNRSAAARFAATALVAEAAEQLELATTAAARATTARLSGATARLFDDRAAAARLRSGTGRLFDDSRTAAARLDFRGTTAATAITAQVLEERVGLAFQGNHRNHQGHYSESGTQHKTLAHHNSSN